MSDTTQGIGRLSPEKRKLLLLMLKEQGVNAAQQPTIPRRGETETLPLSFAQQRLWFLDQLEPGNAAYNIASAVRLQGSLNVSALRHSFNDLITRHESLRTRFAVTADQPRQVIDRSASLPVPMIDLSALPANEVQVEAERIATREGQRGFDLTHGPLLRVQLLHLSAEQHILLLTLHHIIGDGWSMRMFIKEMTTLYEAFAARQPSPLADLPIQYGDYAVWQREQLQGEKLEEQLHYWREQLQGAPVLLELPAENPRPPMQSYRGAELTLKIAPEITRALKIVSQQHGVTLFMTLLAAFQALLYRYTGQDDILVGTPVAGRTRAETEGLIGFFLNTLALRVSMKGDPSFAALLSRVREACLGAYAHQDVPFEQLLEELAPERTLSHTPIFQVMFNMLNFEYVGEQIELNGLTISSLPVAQEEHGAKFDLELYAREHGDGLQLRLVYSELFTSVAMQQMLGHLHTLLQTVAADPARRLASLSLSTDVRAQESLIHPTNPFVTFANEEIEQTIQDRFEKQVRSYPENSAIKLGKESWTYRELNYKANQIARAVLAACGDGEQRIALLLNHDAMMVAGILGVLKAGKTYVPLNAAYPEQRLIEVFTDSEAVCLLTNDLNVLFAERLNEAGLPVINLDRIDSGTLGDNLQVQCSPDSLAYILYTSGSTGKPKGVVQNHRNVLHHIRTYTNNLHLCTSDNVSLFSSYAFDAAVMDIFGAVLNGATLCPIDVRTEDLNRLAASLREEEITIYHSTPTVYRYFLNTLRDRETFPSVRLVVLGGEAVQKRDFELYRQHFPSHCLFVNGLGPTESTVSLQYFLNQQTEITHDIVPVGHAVENTEVSLVNEAGEQVAIYGVGEIVIKSPHVALGYWRRPESTQTQFLIDGDRRSYRTGDLGRRLPDGMIEFVGRRDDQVKIRGHRVELGEVEAALRACRGISECAVVMGRGANGKEARLVGYVVRGEPANEVSASEWRQQLEERLPQYMVPSVFMVIEKMPLTATGKVNRRALPEVQASPAELGREYEAPRTETEEMLVSVWRELLNVERIGIHDNFFALGGHSLLATQVISRLRSVLAVEVPLRSLFEQPTVAGLAQCVDVALRGGESLPVSPLPPLLPVARDELLPLSFAQQRLWFIDQLEPENATYNLPASLRLTGKLDYDALQRTLNEVVQRHEVLRTTFVNDGGQPRQNITAEAHVMLPLIDLSGLAAYALEAEVERLARAEAARPFVLFVGPLLRASLLRLGEEEHVLLFTMHHIISDGWSMGILIKEVVTLYSAYSTDSSSPLPELSIQYADYAVWQREWLQGKVLEKQLQYWTTQLASAPPVLQLPTDHARPTRATQRGDREVCSVPPELAESLKRLGQAEGVTLYMVLLAAFQVLLYRYTEEEDLVVGTPIANRTQADTEGLIGFFVNTLVLRTDLSGNPTFSELLQRVREVCLGAYAHQELPFEMLIEALRPERVLGQQALAQVMFMMQNMPRAQLELPGLKVSGLGQTLETVKYDLLLTVVEAEGLQASFSYNAELFEPATIARLSSHFVRLLEAIVAAPATTITALPLLSDAERGQLLHEWNETTVDYPQQSIQQVFEAQVARTPEAIALVYIGKREDETVSYGELNDRANQLAHYLRTLGVGAETLVGICVERSIEMVVGLLGILKAGGTYVPLDPNNPSVRLAWLIEDAGVQVLLTQQSLGERLQTAKVLLVHLDTEWELIAKESATDPPVTTTADSLAYVIYTSGSTGEPKGVAVRHRGVMRLVFGSDYTRFGAEEVYLQLAPLSFDASTFELWAALLHGARCVLYPERVPSAPQLRRSLREQGASCLFLTTALFNQLVAEDAETLSGVQQILTGGEAISVGHVRHALAELPATELTHVYGPTETTTFASFYRIPVGEEVASIPIGRGIGNTDVYVLDGGLGLAPVGVNGELYLGGAGLARGYLHEAGLTAAKFVPHPYSETGGERLYRTGDVVRWRGEGELEFVGRRDGQVKLRGYRIELGEIEWALQQHAQVSDVAVVLRDEQLVAYVVGEVSSTELRQYLRARVPEYMVPAWFVQMERLPLTANGKLDRRVLPAPELSGAEENYVAPRTPVEEVLAGICQELLHVERVGVTDNFFELGGHSLLATQVISRLRTALAVDIPLRSLFEQPTIAQLAEFIEQARNNGAAKAKPPTIVRVPRPTRRLKELSSR